MGGGPLTGGDEHLLHGHSSWYRHERHRELLGDREEIIGQFQSDEVMEREEQKDRGKGEWRISEEMGA